MWKYVCVEVGCWFLLILLMAAFWEVFFGIGIEVLDLVRRHRGRGGATRQAILLLVDLRIRHVPLSHLTPTPLARQNVAPRANVSPFHL